MLAVFNPSSLQAECSAAVILKKKPPREACFLAAVTVTVSEEAAQLDKPAASSLSGTATGVASSIVKKVD